MDFDGNSEIDVADANAFLALYDAALHDCDGNGEPDLLDILLDPAVDQDETVIPDVCEAAGDVTGNGVVDVQDLVTITLMWGNCPPASPCFGDTNQDGRVDVIDLLAVILNWG